MFSALERLMSDQEQFQICKKYLGKCTVQTMKEMK